MTRRFAGRALASASLLSAMTLVSPLWADAETKPASPASAPATVPAGPQTSKVQKGDLTIEVRAEAVFQPIDPFEVKPTFKVYGGPLVVSSAVAPGTLVRKDQPIISFDRTHIDWALSSVENELAVAVATKAKLEVDQKLAVAAEQIALRQAEDGVKNAELQKKLFDEIDGPHQLLSADLAVRQAQNSVDDQSDELDQLKKMYAGEELTTATADIVVRRAVRSLEQAKVLLKMQTERREKVKTFDYPITRQRVIDAVEGAKQQLTATKAAQELSAVQRTAAAVGAKSTVESATKKLAELKEDAAQFQFKAPSDGVVVYGAQASDGGPWLGGDPKMLKVGEKVAAGSVLLRVYQPGKLRLTLTVPESQAFWLEQGMKARVTPAAFPLAGYDATIGAVEAVSKPQQGLTYQTTVDVAEVDARLVPGMKASVVIDAGKLKDVVVVPASAVSEGTVQLKKEGGVKPQPVKLGKTDGQMVQVLNGLSEGDEIVVKK